MPRGFYKRTKKIGGWIAWNKGIITYEQVVCCQCRVSFEARPCEGRKYCSRGCSRLLGQNHPRWKGGEQTSKQRKNFYQKRREVRRKGNGGSHTLSQWEELKMQYNYMCLCCKLIEPEITLTEDHIIPISKNGSDNIENIQPLCVSCNSIKHTKIINYKLEILALNQELKTYE